MCAAGQKSLGGMEDRMPFLVSLPAADIALGIDGVTRIRRVGETDSRVSGLARARLR